MAAIFFLHIRITLYKGSLICTFAVSRILTYQVFGVIWAQNLFIKRKHIY